MLLIFCPHKKRGANPIVIKYSTSASCSCFAERVICTDYRDFVELIDLMSNIKEKLDLDQIPHYTTLQKFLSRITSSLFNIILSRALKLFSHMKKMHRSQQSMRPDLRVFMQVIITLEEQGSSFVAS